MPDGEITPELLEEIGIQLDAAPAGSEAAAFQAANRLFNQERYADARSAALDALDRFPENRDMRRLVIASSCIMNDADTARRHFARLSEVDQRRLSSRCRAYGVRLGQIE